MNEQLIRFTERAVGKGMDYATVRQMLLSAGWRDREIAEALGRYLDLPIPRPTRTETAAAERRRESPWPRRARDAFLHLLAFGALFTWSTSLIVLFFIYIDFAFPDPARRITQARLEEILSVVRAQVAVLVVAFPIFVVVWHLLLAEVRRDQEKAKGAIRRWLAYLAIFVGALTIAGDVMTLIYFLLEGALSTRVLLKTLVLMVIAGSLVLYLTLTLRGEREPSS